MDKGKIKKLIVGLLAITPLVANMWNKSFAYKVDTVVPGEESKLAWERAFAYNPRAGLMVPLPPGEQGKHSKNSIIVVDLNANVGDQYGPRICFHVPNETGNSYNSNLTQEGVIVPLVPIFMPGNGEYQYPSKSGDGGDEGKSTNLQFGKDKSYILQPSGHVIACVIFKEFSVAASKSALSEEQLHAMYEIERTKNPNDLGPALEKVVALGADQRYSLEPGSRVRESVVVYRNSAEAKEWFLFPAHLA
jgi:hypothetical protein